MDADEIGVVLLGEYGDLHAGNEVQRTGQVMDMGVGDGLLGRVINPLGRPLDGQGPVASSKRLPIERPAPPIMDRSPVTVPLQTGLKVIDALIPVGRGQRELILGDRQTGKTAIAMDTILNQRGQNVLCVYCAIEQRASAVAKAVATLREKGAMDYTVVVVAEGNDPPGLAYIAPYAATSIAESFMEAGRDVLIVYDDLTQHARAYRELSLLLRRPPGREAFPGDIFYIHSRLLERATHLRKELGGGSLTALPIIETEAQDISAYIPTNLISITDGQIYLSPSLFELGVLPARVPGTLEVLLRRVSLRVPAGRGGHRQVPQRRRGTRPAGPAETARRAARHQACRSNLELHILAKGEETRVEKYGCWRGDHIYVNNGRGGMFKISAKQISDVRNGTDGVLMLAPDVQPWPELNEENQDKMRAISKNLGVVGLKVTEDSALCRHMNALFETQGLAPEHYQQLFLSRYLSLFLGGPNLKLRPILMALGEQNSGKSTLFEKLMWLLVGPAYESEALPGDTRSFVAAVTNNQVKIFDNVDGSDAEELGYVDIMCKCASGGRIPIAQLYATNVERMFELRCDLMFTARYNPFPSHRSDLSRRTLFFPIRRPTTEEYRTVEVMQKELIADADEIKLETLIRAEECPAWPASQQEQGILSCLRDALLRDVRHALRGPRGLGQRDGADLEGLPWRLPTTDRGVCAHRGRSEKVSGERTLVSTVLHALPRNGGKVRLLVCPFCQLLRKALYGWEAGGQFTTSARRSDWTCRSCSGLRYSSEGGGSATIHLPVFI